MTHAPLPIRINPHALLAALVAVGYTPQTSIEQTREAFRQALQQGGFTDESQQVAALGKKTGIPDALFRGHGVSVRFQASAIVFNGIEGRKGVNEAADEPADEYIGWPRYFAVIKQALTLLHNTGAASDFPHTAVRYINALPDLPLNDQLQVKLPTLGNLPSPTSTLYRATINDVRTEESGQAFEVELSLGDKQRVAGRTGKQSVFDITVRAPTTGLELALLLHHINEAHTCEKQVFFGLLDPGYLESLKPVYA